MRLTELWEVRCVCGSRVSSPTREFVCNECHRAGIFDRPDDDMVLDLTDRTLSEKEGVK